MIMVQVTKLLMLYNMTQIVLLREVVYLKNRTLNKLSKKMFEIYSENIDYN